MNTLDDLLARKQQLMERLQAGPGLIALRRTRISASDPPSLWWPGER